MTEQDSIAQAGSQVAKTAKCLASAAEEAVHGLSASTEQVAEHLGDMAREGWKTVRSGSRQVCERARDTSNNTLGYIRDEPVKSILIAAGIGATVVALVALLRSSSGGR